MDKKLLSEESLETLKKSTSVRLAIPQTSLKILNDSPAIRALTEQSELLKSIKQQIDFPHFKVAQEVLSSYQALYKPFADDGLNAALHHIQKLCATFDSFDYTGVAKVTIPSIPTMDSFGFQAAAKILDNSWRDVLSEIDYSNFALNLVSQLEHSLDIADSIFDVETTLPEDELIEDEALKADIQDILNVAVSYLPEQQQEPVTTEPAVISLQKQNRLTWQDAAIIIQLVLSIITTVVALFPYLLPDPMEEKRYQMQEKGLEEQCETNDILREIAEDFSESLANDELTQQKLDAVSEKLENISYRLERLEQGSIEKQKISDQPNNSEDAENLEKSDDGQ